MNELFRALPALLRQFDDNDAVREAVALAAWRKIAGESLLRHAIPAGLIQKHLIIAVADENWKKHLEQLAGQRIFRINSVLGQAVVTFIEFRIDEKRFEIERAKCAIGGLSGAELAEIALNEVDANMRRSADSIKDENLRQQFLLAAGSCLARKKRMRAADKENYGR
ncbi:MAG: DUF721 domain-containing protein [Acidobacteria bacterium]|nr:DUF721 domain-containing protein [Acidobacteriota bacterium]